MNSTVELRRHAENAKIKLWERKSALEQELNETDAMLIAVGRLLKEPSAAKLAALEKARAAIARRQQEEPGSKIVLETLSNSAKTTG
jgi:UDP-N-acetyl-D-mannosaminuronate dehydrogenase